MSVPLVSWNTRYRRQRSPPRSGEGMRCTDGDLKGAHFVWNLTAHPHDTLVVYRVNEPLVQSSLIVRTLVGREPSLEHGLGVALRAGVHARHSRPRRGVEAVRAIYERRAASVRPSDCDRLIDQFVRLRRESSTTSCPVNTAPDGNG